MASRLFSLPGALLVGSRGLFKICAMGCSLDRSEIEDRGSQVIPLKEPKSQTEACAAQLIGTRIAGTNLRFGISGAVENIRKHCLFKDLDPASQVVQSGYRTSFAP